MEAAWASVPVVLIVASELITKPASPLLELAPAMPVMAIFPSTEVIVEFGPD